MGKILSTIISLTPDNMYVMLWELNLCCMLAC